MFSFHSFLTIFDFRGPHRRHRHIITTLNGIYLRMVYGAHTYKYTHTQYKYQSIYNHLFDFIPNMHIARVETIKQIKKKTIASKSVSTVTREALT